MNQQTETQIQTDLVEQRRYCLKKLNIPEKELALGIPLEARNTHHHYFEQS